jgi:hypothetical protein
MGMGPGDRYAAGYTGGPGDPTAGERLARRKPPGPAEPRRLPASGPPMRDMRLERNRDYLADSDLVFERGQYLDRIRLTGTDLHALRALLNADGDLKALGDQASRWARDALEEAGPDTDEWALRMSELVIAAHAAGYRLAADDISAACEDAAMVADFLRRGLLEQQLEAERAEPDSVRAMRLSHLTQAVRDVISMLEDK